MPIWLYAWVRLQSTSFSESKGLNRLSLTRFTVSAGERSGRRRPNRMSLRKKPDQDLVREARFPETITKAGDRRFLDADVTLVQEPNIEIDRFVDRPESVVGDNEQGSILSEAIPQTADSGVFRLLTAIRSIRSLQSLASEREALFSIIPALLPAAKD